MMAAAGFNFRKLMVKLKEKALWFFFKIKEIFFMDNLILFFQNKQHKLIA